MKSFSYSPIPNYEVNQYRTNCNDISDLNPFKIVSDWYDHVNFYDYNVEPNNSITVEFSNIVWKDTKNIGVAITISGQKCYVAVIYPFSRNRVGQYSLNIIHPDVAAILNKQETDRLLGIMEE